MDFYKRVELACQMIPRGKVATYGQIALLCGKPKNARQVGFALSRRITDGQIPCHRIVNSQGILSGSGAFDHADTQKSMLEREGVQVSCENQVDLKEFGWKNSLDSALLLRSLFEEKEI